VEWQELAKSAISASFRGQCFSLPLALERAVALTQTAKGWKLNVDYKVTNTGDVSAPWSWCAHTSYASEAGDRVLLQVRLKRCGWKAQAAAGWARARPGELARSHAS